MSISTNIFKQETKFAAGADSISRLPKFNLPEVAFVGKSNVGKSSLINSLCKHKGLARISNTPGRTRQINFFNLADKVLLVDLPGYGYAKVPASFKANWEKLIVHYLQNSDHLKLVNFLIDARRGIKKDDIDVMRLLIQFDKQFQIILTKSDKKGIDKDLEEQIINSLKEIMSESSLPYPNIIRTSSKNKTGIKELQNNIVNKL